MWKSSFPSLPSTVGGSCQLRDVSPLPPDPVTNLQLVSARKRFSIDRKSVRVTASFSWTAPEFTGTEGSIVGYQVWFDGVPASGNVTRFITHGAQARSAEVEMTFDIGGTDFLLFLQVWLKSMIQSGLLAFYHNIYFHTDPCTWCQHDRKLEPNRSITSSSSRLI